MDQAPEESPDTEMESSGNLLFRSSPSAHAEGSRSGEGDKDGKDGEDEVTDYSDGESVDSDLWDQILRDDMPVVRASPAIPSVEPQLPQGTPEQPQPAPDPAEPPLGTTGHPEASAGIALQSAEDRQTVDVILRNFETQAAVIPLGWELSLRIGTFRADFSRLDCFSDFSCFVVRTRDGEIRSGTTFHRFRGTFPLCVCVKGV